MVMIIFLIDIFAGFFSHKKGKRGKRVWWAIVINIHVFKIIHYSTNVCIPSFKRQVPPTYNYKQINRFNVIVICSFELRSYRLLEDRHGTIFHRHTVGWLWVEYYFASCQRTIQKIMCLDKIPRANYTINLGLALLTLSWDKNWDSHSFVNGYPSFYPRIALVAPSPGG